MSRWYWILAALTAAGLGCGDAAPEGTVASVGERHITADELAEAAGRLYPDELTTEQQGAEARSRALDALIASELLHREGLARGLDQDPEIKATLDTLRRDLVVEAYYELDVWPGIEVSDELVSKRYDEWGSGAELRLAHVLCRDESGAEAVLQLLGDGRDFGELARQRSLHGTSAPSGGDLGYMPAPMVFPDVLEVVGDLAPGAIHPAPIRSRLGYHVVKVLGKRERSLEQQRTMLERAVHAEQKAALERASWARLGHSYALRWNPELALLMARRQELPSEQVLYSWDGGRLTASDYVRRAGVPQPVFEDTAKIHGLAERLAMRELVYREGERRGYGQLESVQRRLDEESGQLFATRIYEQEVLERDANQEDILEFYREHRDQYRDRSRVTVREIFVANQSLADSLHRLVAAGEDMGELARRFTLRTDLRQAGGLWEDVDATDPRSAGVYRAALGGQGLLEPIKVPGGYSVADVIGAEPGRILDFAEVEGAVRRDVATVAMDEFLDGLREKYVDVIQIR